jgi:hypothetical protein
MKNTTFIAVVAAIFVVADCGRKAGLPGTSASQETASTDISPKHIATQSPIIVYASADTNSLPIIHLIVTEVWKGLDESSAAGITNGAEYSFQWPTNGGSLPEGAVLFFRRESPSSKAFELGAKFMVRAGRIAGNGTTQEFKSTLNQ